jgi:predicted oxidoreductase
MAENLVSEGPRSLGEAGQVGPIGLGIWRMTVGSTSEHVRLLESAADLGATLLDTADVYGLDWGGEGFGSCEEALGRALRSAPGLRDRLVVAAKVGIVPGVPYDSSAKHLEAACEASLTRMGIDYADVLLVHRPDPFTHPQEVAAAFASLRTRGLVREFGVSNYLPLQVAALQRVVERPLVAVQPRFSCAHTAPLTDGTLDQCTVDRMVPLAWSALDGGRIATGEGVRSQLLEVLDDLATRERVTRAALAIAFVLAHPATPVAMVGTQRPDRLAEIAKATQVRLDRSDLYRIIEASTGSRLP